MDDRSREIILREIEREKKEKQAGRRKQIRKQRSALFLIITVLIVLIVVLFMNMDKVTSDFRKMAEASKKASEERKAAREEKTKEKAKKEDPEKADGLKDSEEDRDDGREERSGAASLTDAEETDFELKMNFVGDCCMASNLQDTSYGSLLWYEQNYPTTYFFDNVRSVFEQDDITIANCENVFSDKDTDLRDKGGDIVHYWFKAPTRFAKVFADNSIEAVTIKNNHTYDYGPEALEDTKKALDEAGTLWGYDDTPFYFEKNGFRICVLCVTFYVYDEVNDVIPWLEKAEQESDFQIVYFHGGTEHVTQPEDWKIQACHLLVDKGADLVIGSHPHILQKRENYNGVDIVYSLGNFCFGGNSYPTPNSTIIYGYDLKIHRDGDTFTVTDKEESMTPCYVYTGGVNNWQPAISEDEGFKERIIEYMNGTAISPE